MEIVTLTAPGTGAAGPRFTSAEVIPARGMMLLQARADIPGLGEIDLIHAPPRAEAIRRLTGDAFGNEAFAFGGAILAPFANRIRGLPSLPENWGGKAPGAARYAMHGLILDRAADELQVRDDAATALIRAGDFDGRWPGSLDLSIGWSLSETALNLTVTAASASEDEVPVGIGWHPYFNLPSDNRAQTRLTIPASSRALVDNYDEVLPTGEVEAVAGTPHDFSGGRALGGLYLDDCFCDLEGRTVEIDDGALRLFISSASPQVTAFQVYAPPDKAFVVVEPQYNLADPFWSGWGARDTGMVRLAAGQATTYSATVSLRA